jgi:hypothetical protein
MIQSRNYDIDRKPLDDRFNTVIKEINKVDEFDSDNRIILACDLLKTLLNEKINSCIHFDTACNLVLAMKGSKRATKLLNILVSRKFINPQTITQNNLNSFIRELNTKDHKLNDILTELLVNYKKININNAKNVPRELTNIINEEENWVVPKEKSIQTKPFVHTVEHSFTKEHTLINDVPFIEEHSVAQNATKIPLQELKQLILTKNLGDLIIGHYECHLDDNDFHDAFNMSRNDFYLLPKWKQMRHKIQTKLF